ncbi:hypothetical protein [Sphingobium sp.]|uniref:hypothetical protein n=1 Tax=Sphingobium sp. TaxID=1912891 RepID=UPI0026191A30|nr:hypothetical protein [Sphingobium sp.]
MALLSMLALATWHDALPHVDDVEHAHAVQVDHHEHASDHHQHASGHHQHDSDDQPDSADIMHVAAHAVFQTIALPGQPIIGAMLFAAITRWVLGPSVSFESVKPGSLLRPPRA